MTWYVKYLLGGLVFVIGLYLLLLALIYFFQTRLVYVPWPVIENTPAELGLLYEPVRLQTSDDLTITGWWVPSAEPRGTVLFLHGNAGNISSRLDQVEFLNSLRLNILVIDYRGYGESEGQPSEAGTYRDAEAAWVYLTETRSLPAEEIVIFGRSLGGGVATWLAWKYPPRALILESTFASLTDVAAHHYPFFPVRRLIQIHYPSIERIPDIRVPLLIIHSPDDTLIPVENGHRLYAAANEPKQFVEITGGHADGYRIAADVYQTAVAAFFDEVFGP